MINNILKQAQEEQTSLSRNYRSLTCVASPQVKNNNSTAQREVPEADIPGMKKEREK